MAKYVTRIAPHTQRGSPRGGGGNRRGWRRAQAPAPIPEPMIVAVVAGVATDIERGRVFLAALTDSELRSRLLHAEDID